MSQEPSDVALARKAKRQHGVFSRAQAAEAGLTDGEIRSRIDRKRWVKVLPNVFRAAGTPETKELHRTAALLWAGPAAVVFGLAAAELWPMGIAAPKPEIILPRKVKRIHRNVTVHYTDDRAALQVCRREGFPVTSAAATLVALATMVDDRTLENAFEAARRNRVVTISSMRRYLDTHARRGVRGAGVMRALVDAVDPAAPSRSDLEIATRRLLVANGITDFVREYPMKWMGETYYFDFAFLRQRVILETNGEKWHNDPVDHEQNNEKWSVPGRFGFRIVFATWDKVERRPHAMLEELRTALAA